MLRSKKALSPVVASIILIAVTVAVSIAVAAWMAALPFTFMRTNPKDIAFSDNYANQTRILSQLNVTIVSATTYKVENYIPYIEFDSFLAKIAYFNVSYVLSDYKSFEYPKYIDTKQLYFLGNYHIWFYIDLPHVGETAVVYMGTEYAWLKGDSP